MFTKNVDCSVTTVHDFDHPNPRTEEEYFPLQRLKIQSLLHLVREWLTTGSHLVHLSTATVSIEEARLYACAIDPRVRFSLLATCVDFSHCKHQAQLVDPPPYEFFLYVH